MTVTTACVSRPRVGRLVGALACALSACLLFAVAPAAAKVIHNQEGSFNGSDAPGGPFTGVSMSSAAADLSNGDVYVLEDSVFGRFGHSVVDKFTERGVYAGVQIAGSETPQGSFAFGGGFLHVYGFPVPRGISGVAVDNTASGSKRGDVYVADTAHGVIDRFSSSGAFECQITAKEPASRSAEEAAHECNGVTGSQVPGTASIEPTGLAVASNGNVYVADQQHNAIDIFEPSGAYKQQIVSSELGTGSGPVSIALDSNDNLYVTNFLHNVVKFSSTGNFEEVVDENAPWGVAVDPANDHVYVGNQRENPATNQTEKVIVEYEPSANGTVFDDAFAYVAEGWYPALAVGPTGKVYAGKFRFSTGATEVLIYSSDLVIPNITAQAATEVQETSATLHGHLDLDSAHGGGEIEKCQFEYGPTKAYGFTAPCTPGPNYASPADVSAAITELHSSTLYHFRVEASNSNGIPSYSEDATLTTPGLPSIDHEWATGETTTATLKAKINPWGSDTTCQAQYVSAAGFQQSKWAMAATVPCQHEDLGAGFGDVLVKAHLTGLTPNTTYDYRFLAHNQSGLSGAPDRSFSTYGFETFTFEDLNQAGEPETQAGAHPYEVVANITFGQTTVTEELWNGSGFDLTEERSVGPNTKDLRTDLPPGLIGNPTAFPTCSRSLVTEDQCPASSQVGNMSIEAHHNTWHVPVFNLSPSGHNPAEFGAFIEGVVGAWIPFGVRTGSDYGVDAETIDISVEGGALERVSLTIWGVPGDPSHDPQRACPGSKGQGYQSPCSDTEPLKPLLTNPSACEGPLTVTALADTWEVPGEFVKTTATLPAFTGCNQLQFKPTLEALPTTNVADSPSGLHVDLHVPQDLNSEGFEDAKGLATADLKDTRVTLPPGLIVNPASASGLAACSSAQIELHGPDAAKCPDAAKIGRAEVDTPLVGHPLPGAVYVATPYDNPFKSLLAIYVVIDDPSTGVIVKLAGHIEADPDTGQLTTTFDESPQLPFEDFKLDFFGGSRGVLRTASTCGTYESKSVLTPWSAPESGPPVKSSSPFQIKSAPGGAPCPVKTAEEPDNPSFSAGTETPTAGSFSPFVLRLSRVDDSQELKAINTVLPPGLTAKLAGVAECPDSAIEVARQKTGRQEQESPSCPAGSEVGTVTVGAGAGPAPYYTQGHVYLAGPYKGAPFSLAIVTPAVAGPYDLGDVVERAGLYISPETTQVTVKSDPIPTILDGIPLDVRTISVTMGRSDFTLNPTDCEKMSVAGETLSVLGQSTSLSNPFQVGGCEALGFKPKFSVSTSGKTSRQEGASLHVLLTYPTATRGSEANVKSVHVELPKALPSRLSTLKNACLEAVFVQNPGDCPALSRVGSARAVTPLLGVPLEGPAYFVSYGNAKFPELVVVLQGDGITIDLHGETFISSAGITSSTFHSVPDQPITSFELTLPQGPNSALAANGDFCADTKTVIVKRKKTIRVKGHRKTVTRKVKRTVTAPLLMPVTFTAQNGTVLTQSTQISVSGCSKAVKAKPKKRRHSKRRK